MAALDAQISDKIGRESRGFQSGDYIPRWRRLPT